MRKLFAILALAATTAVLTGCGDFSGQSGTEQGTMTMELKLDQNYDDEEPFVNEKLFCVSEDMDNLTAEGTLELDGEKVSLEVKNNGTGEVLWKDAWEGETESEQLEISLEELKKDEEYVLCLTGTGINAAAAKITFHSSSVQEKERPSRQTGEGHGKS